MTLGDRTEPGGSIILRPEVRYDNNHESQPFDDNHDLLTAAVDVIVGG